MAQNQFQQQSLRRKLIYFALILAMFTLSIGHRKFLINAQAENMRMRETDQGEVDLTGSTVRLLTTGLRGIAITSLWMSAIEKQKKHEWNELELAVSSLTKLQPHFISPWLFQSWNLAFNVAVECDKDSDKYYFVTRGIALLAEGERRNKGNEHLNPELRSPANPEMRFHLGFTYQLKIGQSDSQNVMQCLLDMSMMDPKDRNPDNLWASGAQGQKVDRARFVNLCQKYPRFVRRLQEKLRISSATDVVRFLADNRDVPSRFEKVSDVQQTEPLLEATKQFPIVPPQDDPTWPNAASRDFGMPDVDVFQLVRAWYGYAQKPLPPADPNPGIENRKGWDPFLYRLPRMSHYIFRGYPGRAWVYYAEQLQKEGWFHEEGWSIKKFFATESDERGFNANVLVGKFKYYSDRAWDEGYRAYEEYGLKNGLYIPPEQYQKLEKEREAKGPDSFAAKKLKGYEAYRQMTNFDAFHTQTAVERLLPTVQAREKLFQARKQVVEAANARTLGNYQQALLTWLDVLLQHPKFRNLDLIQEDTYELQLKFLRKQQDTNSNWLRPLLLNAARLAPLQPGGLLSPVPYARPALGPGLVGLAAAPRQGPLLALSAYVPGKTAFQYEVLSSTRISSLVDSLNVVPIFSVLGPFDVYAFEGSPKDRDLLTDSILNLSETGLQLPGLCAAPLLKSEQERRRVLALPTKNPPPSSQWKRVISELIVLQVRERLGITKMQKQPKAVQP